MSKMWRTRWGRRSTLALPVIAVAVGAAIAERPNAAHGASFALDTSTAKRAAAPTPAVAKLEDLSDAFATIAARVKPSVVYIVATQNGNTVAHHGGRQRPQQGPGLDQIPPEFRQFFQMPGGGDQEAPPQGRSVASGSGFIVSADGYILTNNHVVDGASEVRVRLLDRREYKAKVVGRDPNTDVAVIKIDATDLTAAPLGDSEASRVGEWVLAVGNPLGENLTFTVTQGIISAKGRALGMPGQSQQSIQDFIQTDAAINPGNSGGPLVNVRGEVIGINSAIESPTGYNTGYGFAVPINLARSVMSQIIKNGHVDRVALGIQVRDAGADDAAYVGTKQIGGVLVEDFADKNSPAAKAGLQPGDVIVAVDGKPVSYVAQLQETIAFRKPGDMVNLEVARKGGEHATIRVPLQRAAFPEESAPANEHGDADRTKGSSMHALGASVTGIDAQTAQELRLPSDIRGVIVTDVQEGTSAETHLATPEEGGPDIIMSVEGTPVQTPDQLRTELGKVKAGGIVTLRVYNVPAKTKRIERVRLGGQ
jgi:serine protease Do